MAWCRPGDKPLSEPMMANLLTHICVTRPHWVNSLCPCDDIWRHRYESISSQILGCCLMAPIHYLNRCWSLQNIQIKIGAEKRDMLPRLRLVCLRPIGRSPGVPDKSSRGLGSMSRYSAQILICFIAYVFQISLFLCGFGWILCRTASLHSSLCHFPLLSEWGWSSDNQSSQHALLRCSWPIKMLSCIYVTAWWNWQIKWIKSVSMGSFQHKSQVNGESFAYLWVILLYFSLESRLIPEVLEFDQVRLFWKLIRPRIWQLSHSYQTGDSEYFPSSLALK